MTRRNSLSRAALLCMLAVILIGGNAGFGVSAAEAQTPPPPLGPLEQLLAPVALYPDALLAQILTAATSPKQVTEANDWVQKNQQLHGTALQDAASQQGFDASFVALALFPDVLKMMATSLDWTTELGTAFLSDPKGVMVSVQKLRAQAQAAGNLKTTPQQSVATERQDGQTIIVIQPANPQVVYVPVYNPQVVYYPAPPTAAVVIGFGLGIAIGVAMANNAYYPPYAWGAWGMGWHSHSVVVVGRPWVVPPYARYPYVRPVPIPYGGYRPKPYVYAPTNININKVTVNRPVYAGGVTPRPTPYAPPAARPTTPPVTRPGTVPAQRPTTLPAVPPTAKYPAAPRPANPTPGQLPSTAQRPATGTTYGARGYNPSASQLPSKGGTTAQAQTKSNAFTGYQDGSAERAASQRGKSSASSQQGRGRTPGANR
jgi:hypothetical protein